MTRKTLLYYGLPLLVISTVILGCMNFFIWSFADLIKNGFRSSVLVFQIFSLLLAGVLVIIFVRRFVPFCKVFYYRNEVKRFHFDINMSK